MRWSTWNVQTCHPQPPQGPMISPWPQIWRSVLHIRVSKLEDAPFSLTEAEETMAQSSFTSKSWQKCQLATEALKSVRFSLSTSLNKISQQRMNGPKTKCISDDGYLRLGAQLVADTATPVQSQYLAPLGDLCPYYTYVCQDSCRTSCSRITSGSFLNAHTRSNVEGGII